MAPEAPDYVIWSLRHHGWWRPARAGYTTYLVEAGRFTQADVEALVDPLTDQALPLHLVADRAAHACEPPLTPDDRLARHEAWLLGHERAVTQLEADLAAIRATLAEVTARHRGTDS